MRTARISPSDSTSPKAGIWDDMPRKRPPSRTSPTQLAVVSAVANTQSVKSGRGTAMAVPAGAPRPSAPWQEAQACS